MHRRTLLTALGAAVLPTLAGSRGAWRGGAAAPLDRIGLQLYTVRSEMQRDLPATLRAVAAAGYREVEFAGYFGRPPRELRTLLASLGLEAPAAHVPFAELRGEWSRALDVAAEVGHRWVVVPWLPQAERRTVSDWQRVAALFNESAAAARAAGGLRFAYHNHDFEFSRIGDTVPFDVLLDHTDPDLVDFELDLYWITRAGFDATGYLARHPGRFPMVHVKDSAGPPDHRMVDVGRGTIDWRALLARARESGTRHYFVEHDDPADPFGSMRASFAHLAALGH